MNNQYLLYKLLTILVLIGLFQCLQGQELHFRHIDVQEGLPSNRVYSLHLDSLGLIWAATERGLTRYDGRKFVKYTTQNGLPTNIFYDFLDDANRGFYALGENGAVTFFNGYKFITIPKPETIPKSKGGYFTHLNTLKHSVRAKFAFNIYEFRKDSTVLIKPTDKTESSPTCLCSLESESDQNFELLVSRNRQKIIVTSRGQEDSVLIEQNFEKIVSIDKCPIQRDANNWFFFNDKSLYRLDFSARKIVQIRQFKESIECIQFDLDGGLWVGTMGNGLWQSQNLIDWFLTSKPYLAITDIQFDQAEGLWVSTLRNGLFYCPLVSMETIFKGQYESLNVTNNKICIASNKQFIWYDLATRSRLNQISVEGLAISVEFDKYSHEWHLGCNKGLLLKADTNFDIKALRFPKNQYFRGFSQNKSYEVASLGVGCLIGHQEKAFYSRNLTSFGDERFSDLVLDSNSNLFYSCPSGTYRHNLITGVSEKFSQDAARKILISKTGCIVLGTEKSGIQIYDSGLHLIKNLNKELGLPSNQIFAISESSSSIYVIHANGLSIIIDYLNTSIILNYPELSSIISDLSYISLWKGYVILGNLLEVVKFPIAAIEQSNVPQFKVKLSTRDNAHLPLKNGVKLNHNQRDLIAEIMYASFDSRKGYPLRYRTQTSDPWTEFDERITVNNLPTGNHLFEVEYLDHAGNWNPVNEGIPFEIIAPFWKRGWFAFLIGIIIITIISLAARQFYVYKLVRVEADLEQKNQLRELQLKALKAQLNPHFIFNVMTSINYYLARNDVSKARDFLLRFSRLVRKILEHSDHSYISLEQELSLLDTYISIESDRIGGEPIEFEQLLGDGRLKNALISPGILQPFVENSIWHGLRTKKGQRLISIHVQIKDGELIVSISDNGIGRKKAQKMNKRTQHKSFGLRLSSERLKILSMDKADQKLKVTDRNDPSGTIVELKLPLLLN